MVPESVAEFIMRHDAGRLPDLLLLRYQRMQANAFAFFRGSAPLYYHRSGMESRLRDSPTGWLSGDAHVENFGSFRGDNDLVYFDLNDFDESVRGPVLWDVGRLTVSVLLAAAEIGLAAAEQHLLACHVLATYAAALAAGKAYWLERTTATGVVAQLLRNVKDRGPRALLHTRASEEGGWHLLQTPALHPLHGPAQAKVRAAVEAWRRAQTVPPCGPVLDVAQRVAGVGSLGVPRYALLVAHRNPHKLPKLLDLKQAPPSAAGHVVGVPQPAWVSDAHRVVQAQIWLQAVPPALLQPVALDGQPFVLRTLQPVADKLDFTSLPHRKAAFRTAVPQFAQLLAWAHLRAAGHQGAAGPDALQTFGSAHDGWRADVLRFALRAAAQVRTDYRDFSAACHRGEVPLPPHPQSSKS